MVAKTFVIDAFRGLPPLGCRPTRRAVLETTIFRVPENRSLRSRVISRFGRPQSMDPSKHGGGKYGGCSIEVAESGSRRCSRPATLGLAVAMPDAQLPNARVLFGKYSFRWGSPSERRAGEGHSMERVVSTGPVAIGMHAALGALPERRPQLCRPDSPTGAPVTFSQYAF